jgi:hypothetical protein
VCEGVIVGGNKSSTYPDRGNEIMSHMHPIGEVFVRKSNSPEDCNTIHKRQNLKLQEHQTKSIANYKHSSYIL